MNAKTKMFFKMITSSILKRRSRMIIALLAIIVGATILSGLVTIYYDVPRQMGAQFRNYGANMIFTSSSSDAKLTDEAVKEGVKKIPAAELKGYTPYRYEAVRINKQPVIAAGTDIPATLVTSPYWFVEGKRPEKDGEVLVGKTVADLIGARVGESINVQYYDPDEEDDGLEKEGVDLTVSGILETGSTEEEYIYASFSDLELITGKTAGYDVVELSVSSTEANLEKYAKSVEDANALITARLVTRVTSSEGAVLTKLQSLVFIVTAVVLVLTMICVATTMTAVIAERRKEIGLRKALGASNASIMKEFLSEGVLLGGVGGVLGSVFGFVFAEIVSVNVFSGSITFRPFILVLSLLASIVVTGLSSLIPIRSATEIDPALILKGE